MLAELSAVGADSSADGVDHPPSAMVDQEIKDCIDAVAQATGLPTRLNR